MKVVLSLCFVILLAGCAPTLTPVPSPVGESPTPAATRTPVPPTATATVTPMPKLTREDLKSMSGADKLKMAPQAESAPKDVVSSFAAGENARDIAWSGKSLTFWERVVACEGTTKSGEKVTLYFDLESGQWAKQYADFDEVSKIPADEVAETMVIGGRLAKNKPAFVREWPDQTEKTLDGKMVFRDEHGNPLAVFDVGSGGWLAPEQAGVDFPLEIATEARADGKYPKYDVEKMGGIDKFMRLLVASEAQALREGKVAVDPQAVNYGWFLYKAQRADNVPNNTKYFGPIYNVADSPKREPPYKLVSISVVDGSMFGPKYIGKEIYLMGIALNNPNPTSDSGKTTIGILHIEITKLNLPWFLENINNGVKGILFMGKVRISENSDWEDEPFNDFQSGGDYKNGLLQSLVDQGNEAVITPEMEEIIYFARFR
ncbi:conserved hypothetical protein [Candidatus Denitrolinea symbiosum]|nr:conserved hypothetical protein [Candidatus Denitrolinea symbiosum]